MGKMKRAIGLLLMFTMILSMVACKKQTDNKSDSGSDSKAEENLETDKEGEGSSEPVTIKLFTNLPDRTTGQGLLEQEIIDKYMEENPNVTIEIEALQDEAYKTKFTAYTSSNNLPDVLSVWGQPAFIDPVINSGYLAELNEADYGDYNFIPGSLAGFSKDGKIYGLPRNTDIQVIFYNKKLFADNNIEVPTTMKELYDIADKFNDLGIAPCAMDGKDKWPLAVMYSDFIMKLTGDNTLLSKSMEAKDFSDPNFEKAADAMNELISKDFFQKSFTAADYGAARNLFAQGKAAMFYMGSWEMSMATDEAIPEEVRDNVGAFSLPAPEGAASQATDLSAWNGGGYSVAENSPVKEEAIKFLNYLYQPENWAKGAWQEGICIPAQSYEEYLTGNETEVQQTLTDLLTNATNISGTPINDNGMPTFKTACEDLSQEFATGIIDAKTYVEKLNEALK